MSGHAPAVVIGMDPHKRSVTIEVMTADETIVGGGRFDTDAAGYAAMLTRVGGWPDRMWAIEGCNGIGRHVAMRLLTDGVWTRRARHIIEVPHFEPRVVDGSSPHDDGTNEGQRCVTTIRTSTTTSSRSSCLPVTPSPLVGGASSPGSAR